MRIVNDGSPAPTFSSFVLGHPYVWSAPLGLSPVELIRHKDGSIVSRSKISEEIVSNYSWLMLWNLQLYNIFEERMWHFQGVKTYSDPSYSYIFSGGRDPNRQDLRPWCWGWTCSFYPSNVHVISNDPKNFLARKTEATSSLWPPAFHSLKLFCKYWRMGAEAGGKAARVAWLNSDHGEARYRKTCNTNPLLLLEQVTWTPGLYWRYWRPGFYLRSSLY